MARIKLLVYALIALGLFGWCYLSLPAGSATGTTKASGPAPSLDAAAGGVRALLEARSAWERAAAQTAITSAPLANALANAAKNGGTPGNDAAEPLKSAADQSLAGFPEGARHYVVVALATATGALASVPGHDPLTAASFTWIDEALKAGPTGYATNVAGKKVVVYAAPIRAVVKDEVKELGSLAIAFSREPADWAPFVAASPLPFTLIADHKVVASSDKAHADAVKGITAAGPASISGGSAVAVPIPGLEGAFAVVAAGAPTSGASAPAASGDPSKNLLISMGALGVATVVFLVLMGGAPAPAREEDQVAPPMRGVESDHLRSTEPSMPTSAAQVAPPPAPSPRFPVTAAAPPPPAPPPVPPPLPAATAPIPPASAAGAPGFDDLFGSAQPPTRPPTGARPAVASRPASPAAVADPLSFLNASPPTAPAPTAPHAEVTGSMSTAQLTSLAAQAARADVVALPPPMPSRASRAPDPEAIPLPSMAKPPDPFALAGGDEPPPDQPHERTVVAAVPQELLRAAGQRPATQNGIGVAGPMAASANAEELHYQDVYREFLQVRERCGEPQENLTFEKFSAKLRKNKEQLVQKYACKSVRFQVYVKDNKAALKATPVKDG